MGRAAAAYTASPSSQTCHPERGCRRLTLNPPLPKGTTPQHQQQQESEATSQGRCSDVWLIPEQFWERSEERGSHRPVISLKPTQTRLTSFPCAVATAQSLSCNLQRHPAEGRWGGRRRRSAGGVIKLPETKTHTLNQAADPPAKPQGDAPASHHPPRPTPAPLPP